jgi:hypothetical protein
VFRPAARALLLALPCLVAPAAARADVVELAGGTRVEGTVLERTGAGLRVLLRGGDELTLRAADVKGVTVDETAPGGDRFLRFVGEGPDAGMQVGIVSYVKPGAPRVDLVGAVHAAEKAYFEEIQRVLDRSDLVLYEMVKGKDQEPWAKTDAPAAERSAIAEFQATLARAFDLVFQMDAIDYRRRRFVHADMTSEEFLAKGGGTLSKEMEATLARVRPLLAMAARFLNPGDVASPAARATAAGMRTKMKGMIGAMLGGMGGKIGGLLGSMGGEDLILRQRNEVAIAAFDAARKDVGNIAIFYGAAHMPDLEQRLLARGWVRAGGRWLVAWSTTPPKEAAPTTPAPKAESEPVPAK